MTYELVLSFMEPLTGRTDDVSIVTGSLAEITETAETIVDMFDYRDFDGAFVLQDTKSWGPFETPDEIAGFFADLIGMA